jgi:hypothetical protein
MQTKSRTFQGRYRLGEESEDAGKTWKGANNPWSEPVLGSQVTESENHTRLPNGAWNGGGPFNSVRIERSFPTTDFSWKSDAKTGFKFQVRGYRIGAPLEEASLPAAYRNMTPAKFKSIHSESLDADGATAINLSAPTNPNAELGTAMAETYREGIPSLPGIRTWKKRTEIVRAAADEFLNAEFGWLPLVSDVKNTANSVRHSRDILHQYGRDSGSNVRREFSFPISETEFPSTSLGKVKPSVTFRGTTAWPGFINQTVGLGAMDLTESVKVTTRRWFSGCFTYTVPNHSDSWYNIERNASDADKLFGISLTPDLLWELTPWSWAVDWFTNAGDVIANVNHFVAQGLVMRYGYMMEESIVDITHSLTANSLSAAWPPIPDSKYVMTSKRRIGANPFGFGKTSGSLSATQIAIAAALGISLL